MKVAHEGILSWFIVLGGDGLIFCKCLRVCRGVIWSRAVVGQRPTTDLLNMLACMHGCRLVTCSTGVGRSPTPKPPAGARIFLRLAPKNLVFKNHPITSILIRLKDGWGWVRFGTGNLKCNNNETRAEVYSSNSSISHPVSVNQLKSDNP